MSFFSFLCCFVSLLLCSFHSNKLFFPLRSWFFLRQLRRFGIQFHISVLRSQFFLRLLRHFGISVSHTEKGERK
ncbi:unnamed protein product [Rhizophagus irregularis]|nr:unnamed protein product [Rhizophagus irregularis]CAB4383359.1 unnamed protein product [Rhizophagus irregularis]CAB4383360.1 unnamed protein product [Rhizophagus irregularis]